MNLQQIAAKAGMDIAFGTESIRLRHRLRRIAILLAFTLGTLSGCETESTVFSEPDVNPQVDETDTTNSEPNDVMLDARIRVWDEQKIIVDYSLRNDSAMDYVALDGSQAIQIELLEDDRVRLFRGKQNTGTTSFDQTPTLVGRELRSQQSLQGSGIRAVPLTLDFNVDLTVDTSINAFEFCIGYGSAVALLPTLVEDNTYVLNEGVEAQRLTCTTLTRENTQDSNLASPLDETHWENTLANVLNIASGKKLDTVVQATRTLRTTDADGVPNATGVSVESAPTSFISADGTPGSSQRAQCMGGGYFDTVITGAQFGQVFIQASRCSLDGTTVDGDFSGPASLDAPTDSSNNLSFYEFSVDNGAERLFVIEGSRETVRMGGIQTSRIWSDATYEVETGGAITRVMELELDRTEFMGVALDRQLEVSFVVEAPWAFNERLRVSTPSRMGGTTISNTGNYTQGSILIETDSGDQILLNADSGQDDLMLVTRTFNGAITTHFLPWFDGL